VCDRGSQGETSIRKTDIGSKGFFNVPPSPSIGKVFPTPSAGPSVPTQLSLGNLQVSDGSPSIQPVTALTYDPTSTGVVFPLLTFR
jgi:hypothetical protein